MCLANRFLNTWNEWVLFISEGILLKSRAPSLTLFVTKEVDLATYIIRWNNPKFYWQEGVTGEWRGAWVMLIRRVLVYYTSKEDEVKTVDLRKTRCVGECYILLGFAVLLQKLRHPLKVLYHKSQP